MLCPYLGIRRGNIAGLAKFTRDFPDCRKNSVADGQLATPALMVSSHYHMMQLSRGLSESDDWNNTLFICRIMEMSYDKYA